MNKGQWTVHSKLYISNNQHRTRNEQIHHTITQQSDIVLLGFLGVMVLMLQDEAVQLGFLGVTVLMLQDKTVQYIATEASQQDPQWQQHMVGRDAGIGIL